MEFYGEYNVDSDAKRTGERLEVKWVSGHCPSLFSKKKKKSTTFQKQVGSL